MTRGRGSRSMKPEPSPWRAAPGGSLPMICPRLRRPPLQLLPNEGCTSAAALPTILPLPFGRGEGRPALHRLGDGGGEESLPAILAPCHPPAPFYCLRPRAVADKHF